MALSESFADNVRMMIRTTRRPLFLLSVLAVGGLTACNHPDYNAVANKLREQNIAETNKSGALQNQLTERDATIAALQKQLVAGNRTLDTLPADRLADLFTVSKVEIRNTTSFMDADSTGKPAGFRVFLRTYTAEGLLLPASGTLVLEAFDLPASPGEPKRLGTWSFSPHDMKTNYYATFGLNQFALNCPCDVGTAGKPMKITFRAHFTDLLTGRTLDATLEKSLTR